MALVAHTCFWQDTLHWSRNRSSLVAEPYSIDPTAVGALTDKIWRRVGVTQSFEILLVKAALTNPGTPTDVANIAGQQLSGGAARFWDLSREQLQRDLCRRRILILQGSTLQAHTDFAEKLTEVLAAHEAGVSRVEPTPGVTLEDVLRASEERERAAARRSTSSRAKKTPKPKNQSSQLAKPQKRAAAPILDPLGAPVPAPAVTTAPVAPPTPAKKMYTSNRVNRLLDHLDDTTLSTIQLGRRLEMNTSQLTTFLEQTNALQVTRVSKDNLVDLHWRGRELVRTTSADRRMTVLNLVKELRGLVEVDDG